MNSIPHFLLTFLLFSTIAHSATITWSYSFYGNSDPDGTSKNWNDAANWDLGRIPTSSDDVVIDQYVDTNGVDDFIIQMPSSVTVKSLTHPASLISVEGPCTLTVDNLTVEKGIFREMTIVVNNAVSVTNYVTCNKLDLTVSSGATFETAEDARIELGEGSLLTNNGVINFGSSVDVLCADYNPNTPAKNTKIINNGQIVFDGKTDGYARFGILEYEQISAGSMTVKGGERVLIQIIPDNVPSGVEIYTGAPASWDGSIKIQGASELQLMGGEISWASSMQFDLSVNALLHLDGWDDLRAVHNFAKDFNVSSGTVAINTFTDIKVVGTMNIKNLEWRSGSIINTNVNVERLSCDAPNCCFSQNYRTLDGGHMKITGESDMSDCGIDLNNEAIFEVSEDSVIHGKDGYIYFKTGTVTAPGTFLNKGRVVLMPQDPTGGRTHRWFDVSVDNRGSFECLKSLKYDYCMGIMPNTGSTAESVSSGVFNISSTVTNYLEDGVLVLQGHWDFKEGHQFAGGSVTTLHGDSGNDCEDISQQVCDHLLVMNFAAGTTFNIDNLRLQYALRIYSEGDMVIKNIEWLGGYWGGAGLVTVTEEMSIKNGKKTSDSAMILAKKIIIEKKLVVTWGFIKGVDNAEIVIRPDAELHWLDSARLGIQDENDGSKLTVTNEGTINMIFDDRYMSSGVVNIVNKGLMQMKEVDGSYSDSDVIAALDIEEGASISLEEEGTFVVRIRANRENTYDDDEELSDFFELYEAASCKLGGTLQLEFVQPTGCFPTCDEFVVKAGSQWRIMRHRMGDEIAEGHHPCYGEFSTLNVTGLPDGLKAGIIYNEDGTNGLSDQSYIVVVVCEESATTCGSPNKHKRVDAPTDGTNGTNGTGTESQSNSVSLFVVFTLFLLSLL